jgi:hypothetical protein
MTDERTFTNVDDAALIREIKAAQRKIVFVAPGVQKPVADALAKRLSDSPDLDIAIILDIDPEVCRLGYGHIDGLSVLKAACEKRGTLLLHQPGIRIGLFIADDLTLVYSPTPLLIEAGSKQPDKPNAIRLETAAVPKVEAACTTSDEQQSPEIGLDPAKTPDIQAVKKDLEVNPPQQFDVSQKVRVFNSRIQYVDFNFTGYQLSRKEVTIPPALLGLADNKELAERWQNYFRIFGEWSDFAWKARVKNEWGRIGEEVVTEKTLDAEKKQIIKDFLVPLPNYGAVIQRSMRPDFDKRIHRFRAKVRGFTRAVNKQLEDELTRNRRNLATELAQRLKEKPPPVLRKTLPSKPTVEVLVDVIDEQLSQNFGEVKDVFAPKVELRFKEVSYETLSDPGFIAALKKAFKKTFGQLFSEYDAAPATGPAQKRGE